jgi:hypothetical protein
LRYVILCRIVLWQTNRNDFNETLYKELNNEKLSYMFGRIFRHVFGEKSNVKMGKSGGGGQSIGKS